MRYGQERSREGHERFLHGLLGRNIQMVGRLIEHEEIRPREHELQKGHPRLLPAGKRANPAIYIIAGKEERSQITPGLLLGDPVFVQQLIEYGIFHMKAFMLLGKVPDFHPAANLHASRRRFQLTGDQAQQRSLTDTVRSDDGYTIALADQHR